MTDSHMDGLQTDGMKVIATPQFMSGYKTIKSKCYGFQTFDCFHTYFYTNVVCSLNRFDISKS